MRLYCGFLGHHSSLSRGNPPKKYCAVEKILCMHPFAALDYIHLASRTANPGVQTNPTNLGKFALFFLSNTTTIRYHDDNHYDDSDNDRIIRMIMIMMMMMVMMRLIGSHGFLRKL